MAPDAQFAAQERLECRSFGTIPESRLQSLVELLEGLAGLPGRHFRHHEVVQSSGEKPPALVHLLHGLEKPVHPSTSSSQTKESQRWMVRREMVNTRGAIKDLAVSVRMVSEMPMTGTDVLGFWSALGFSHVRESLKTGLQYTVPTSSLPVQVSVYRLLQVNERNNVESASDISPHYHLVEALCHVASGSHTAGAESIGKLQDMLRPLVCLQKG